MNEKDNEILLKIVGPLELEVMKIMWFKARSYCSTSINRIK
ncbi:hypothetical protein [Peribacillus frigoritolerans]